MANFIDSLKNSSGAASIKSAIDFWNGDFEKPFLPAPPVLSGQYELDFYIGDETEPIHLFDIDNITKTLVTNEKKSFRPYGFSHTVKLIHYQGWDIKITGKKTNPALNYLIQKVYQVSSYPLSYSPNFRYDNVESIIMPKFKMVETIHQYPDEKYKYRIEESYSYNDIIITGYDEEVPDDNMPLAFTLSLFAKNRAVADRGIGTWDYSKNDRLNKIDLAIDKFIR